MKHPKMKLTLIEAVRSLLPEAFTVGQLTDAYLNLPNCEHQTKKPARQFVYRNIQRLLESGDMKRIDNQSRWPRYKAVSRFLLKTKASTNSAKTKPVEDTNDNAVMVSREKLKERLNQHKLDMLSALGEAEEYNIICNELPSLRGDAQELYNQARDRCSEILGRIKALESLLGSNSPTNK
jgi:hypothetical protein